MQQTQPTNPFQQVLDDEAYNLLTKCDRKLGVAVLSLALKKFSESKEFLYFLKPENRAEFEKEIVENTDEQVSGNQEEISMIPESNQPNQNTETQSAASAITVAW